jgi:hypothetical protein
MHSINKGFQVPRGSQALFHGYEKHPCHSPSCLHTILGLCAQSVQGLAVASTALIHGPYRHTKIFIAFLEYSLHVDFTVHYAPSMVLNRWMGLG